MPDNAENRITAQEATGALLAVLKEIFYGVQKEGAFLDPGPFGLLDMVRSLSAKQASTPICGASVAANAQHVAFSLDVYLDAVNSETGKDYDWDQSWAVSALNKDEWMELAARLETKFKAFQAAANSRMPLDSKAAFYAMGALAHCAYHLGIMQTKVDELKDHAG